MASSILDPVGFGRPVLFPSRRAASRTDPALEPGAMTPQSRRRFPDGDADKGRTSALAAPRAASSVPAPPSVPQAAFDFGRTSAGIVVDQGARQVSGLELMRADFAHRRDFRGSSRNEAFAERRQLVGHDPTLGDFDAASPRQFDRRLPGHPSRKQSAMGVCRTPSLMKKTLAPVHSATRPCQSSIKASA